MKGQTCKNSLTANIAVVVNQTSQLAVITCYLQFNHPRARSRKSRLKTRSLSITRFHAKLLRIFSIESSINRFYPFFLLHPRFIPPLQQRLTLCRSSFAGYKFHRLLYRRSNARHRSLSARNGETRYRNNL